jgi:hypothetical protein
MLARAGYRVTSGGAPYVGMEAVEAAFRIKPACARFYFRQGGGRNYRRLAPAIIVEREDYSDIRQRFISELSVLIAMGGHRVEGDTGGVSDEIQLAASFGVPVLLFPQFGGEVAALRNAFMQQTDSRYPGGDLGAAVRKANDACAAVAPEQLHDFLQQELPDLIESVLHGLVQGGHESKASSNDFDAEVSW